MKNQRRKFSGEFKMKVVLEAVEGKIALSDLALKFDLSTSQIAGWKKKYERSVITDQD